MAEKEVKIKVTTETDMGQLEDLKATIEEVKSSASQLGDEGSESLNEIGDEAEDATSNVDDLDSSVDELSDNIDNITPDSLNEVATEADNTATSTEEAAESASELADNLDNIDGSGLGQAANEADGLSDSLQNASNSADGVGDSLSVIESASFMGLADGIGQYAAGAENLAQEMNTAAISVGQLSTNVGMAEPQMVSLINHISNATFPQNEAMAYVNALNQMGVEASKLGDAATNMDRINDATHIGYKSTMQLTQGLQAVGVSADNLPSSFNAIAYAQANVNGGADTLSQVLKRQAATINEYGLNVDQLVIIMQKLSERGVQGMKMGSELSKVLKDTNGDTQALEQSLGLTAGALSNAGDATAKYSGKLQQLADEEAEHKTWIDQLNAAWEDMSLTLSPVLSPLMSFVGIIGQFGQFALAVNSITTLVQGITGISIISKIAPMVSSGIGMISGALTFLAANPIVLVVIAIVALVAILWHLYNTNEDVRNAIDGLIATLWSIGETIYGYLVGAIEWLGGAWQNTVDFFTSGGQAIQDALGGAFQWIMDVWNAFVTTITTYGPLIGEILFVMATGGVGAILLLVQSMMGGNTKLGAIFNQMLQKVLSFASNFINNLANAARNAVNNFVTGVSSLPGRVYDELAKTLDRVIQWGSQIVSKLGSIAQQAWQAFIRGLGIGSPGYIQILTLKELADTGKRIPENAKGIVENLAVMADKAVDAWGTPKLDFETGKVNGNGLVNIDNNTTLNNSNLSSLLNELLGSLNNNQNTEPQLIFNLYGDIDDDKRMEKFLNAVRKELNWNNKTAGRTV